MRRTNLVSVLVFMLMAAGGCSTNGGPSLVGAWSSEHPLAGPNTLIFRKDGTAIWRIEGEGATGSVHHLDYAVNEGVRPMAIELKGFSHGPLEGRRLIGIFEFVDEDTLRVDLDSAPVDARGVEPPTDFGSGSTTYRRTYGVAHRMVGWMFSPRSERHVLTPL